MFVYDITNQQSFQDLDDWLNLVKKAFEGKELPLLVMMGNKIDLVHMQAVKTEQHEAFGKFNKFHASYYVSAKTGDQIHQCFFKVAADLAGIEVPKNTMESVVQKTVKAEIQVEHSQNVDSEPRAEEKLQNAKKKDGGCVIF